MNGSNNEHNYNCRECLNKRTPLCVLCTRIVSPGEEASKPSFYINGASVRKKGDKLSSLSSKITAMLTLGDPVPLALVIEYNRLITDEGE